MDDLISRQDAIDALAKWFFEVFGIRESDGTATIFKRLREIPSAQPERKKGWWELNKDGNWACPFCEFDPYHDNMQGMNYCPNCGARLEQESGI